MAWVKEQKANKDYKCDGGCGELIVKGTAYKRVVELDLDDVDINDLGRETRSPRPRDERALITTRFHKGCFEC